MAYVRQAPDECIRWIKVAPRLVASEDPDSIQEFCELVAEQPIDNAVKAERAIRACLLEPGLVEIESLLIDVLTKTLDDETATKWLLPRAWHTRALLAGRVGDAQSAVTYAEISQEQQEIPEVWQAMNLGVISHAQQYLGQEKQAKASLATADKLITELEQDPEFTHGFNLLSAQILFREAEAAINGNRATPKRRRRSLPGFSDFFSGKCESKWPISLATTLIVSSSKSCKRDSYLLGRSR